MTAYFGQFTKCNPSNVEIIGGLSTILLSSDTEVKFNQIKVLMFQAKLQLRSGTRAKKSTGTYFRNSEA